MEAAKNMPLLMSVEVCSCAEKKFTDKAKNETRIYYELYVITDDGSVGRISTSTAHKRGEIVGLTLRVDKEGRLVPRVVKG